MNSLPTPAEQLPAQIAAAHERLAPHFEHFLRTTPLWRLRGAHLGVDCQEVWLKLEQLQVGGSFKARGALNRLLAQPIPDAGVIIASGGNAGIATAAAARHLGVRCEVFLPLVSTEAKRAKLRALGATVVVEGEVYADALAASVARQRETGALTTHAYDLPEVVAGAGTLAAEIVAQAGQPGRGPRVLPDAVLVSVGGGGLVAGVAAGFAALGADTRVVPLEPEGVPTLQAAQAAGQPVDVAVGGVAADSLGAKRVGHMAWSVANKGWLERSRLISDASIVAAQLELWHTLGLAVEPAAALPLAALRTGVYQPQAHERVCLVLCGANVNAASLT